MTNPLSAIPLKNPWHFLATGFWQWLIAYYSCRTMGTLALWFPLYLIIGSIAVPGLCRGGSDKLALRYQNLPSDLRWRGCTWPRLYRDTFCVLITAEPSANVGYSCRWLKWLLTGFVLFRFFDMVKPWPMAGWCSDRKGLGIMIDDIVAGIIYDFSVCCTIL